MRKKILDWLFYDWLIRTIEEEFAIDVYLNVNGKQIGKTKMKHVPNVGYKISYFDNETYKVLDVRLSPWGSVAYLECELV